MLILYRHFFWTVPLILFGVWQLLFLRYSPSMLIGAGLIILFFALWLIIRTNKKDAVQIMILPVLFYASISGAMLFLDSANIRQAIAILASILLGVYIKILFDFFNRPTNYQAYSLENYASFINIITSFFAFFIINGFRLFFNTPLWLLFIFMIIVLIFLFYNYYWTTKLQRSVVRPYLYASVAIMIQVYWAFTLLPTGIFVNAFLLMMHYFILADISRRLLLSDHLERRIFTRYAIAYVLILLLTLATAQWS